MGSSGDRPIRAIAVDLPNLCIETDTPVHMGNNLRPPLLFVDIIDMMRDLYAYNFNVPIFFIIDARVQPHAMTAEEAASLLNMERRDAHDLERIWRMRRRQLGWSTREASRAKEKEKADYAMCDLANRLDVALITEDRLQKEAESGRLQRPNDLIRFVPRRSSRDEQFRFLPATRRTETRSLASLVAPLADDEYWHEWTRCVKVLAQHMDKDQKKWDLECIDYVRTSRAELPEVPTTVDEPAVQLGSAPVTLERAPVVTVPPVPAEEEATPPAVKPARRPEPSRPAPMVPVVSFVFGDLRDLNAHRGRVVEMISRAFHTGSGLEFRLYAAGMGVKVELSGPPADPDNASFMSATGLLDFDGRAWVLRDARINGPVSTEEVQRLKDAGHERRRAPGFSHWGPSPRRRWTRKPSPSLPQPTGGGATTPTAPPAPPMAGAGQSSQPGPHIPPAPTSVGAGTGPSVRPSTQNGGSTSVPPGPGTHIELPPHPPVDTTPEKSVMTDEHDDEVSTRTGSATVLTVIAVVTAVLTLLYTLLR